MALPVPDFPDFSIEAALAYLGRKVESIGWRSGDDPEQVAAAKAAVRCALKAIELPGEWSDDEWNIDDNREFGCVVRLRFKVWRGSEQIEVSAQAEIYPALRDYPGEWQARWVAVDPADEHPPVLFSVHWDKADMSDMSVQPQSAIEPFGWTE